MHTDWSIASEEHVLKKRMQKLESYFIKQTYPEAITECSLERSVPR